MPAGIPPSITALTSSINEQITTFITYLQIPSFNDTSAQFQIALQDTYQASKSTFQLLQLTCRPLFILLTLLSKYIFILLRIISEHTFYHGIKASKEMWRQTNIACVWFVQFQKSLSKTVIYMEIGFVFLCIGLYMIRRYLQRKKYFQKLKRWYTLKKNKVQLKYNDLVDSVAQTSQVLAILLPHILYVIITLALKYFTPSLVRYLANSTILSDVISFYIPFGRTVVVVYKYKRLCSIAERERMESIIVLENSRKEISCNYDDNSGVEDGKSNNMGANSKQGLLSFLSRNRKNSSNTDNKKNTTSSSITTKKKSKSHVADVYEKAASQGQGTYYDDIKSLKKSKKPYQQKNNITPTILHEDELNNVSKEAAELLKYWTVYAILTAFIQTATLLPIIGRIFYNANPINAKKGAASISRWSSRNKSRVSWLDKIKISSGFLEECKFFFFAWLRLLPTSLTSTVGNDVGITTITGDSAVGTGDVKNRIKALEKKSKYAASTQKSTSICRKKPKTETPFSNRPLDIVYDRVVPAVASLVSTSTNFVKDTASIGDVNGNVTDPLQAFKAKCVTFSRTLLEAMVWTKIISESTKNLIINIFVQCASILPAATTMLMPSYFTNHGIIYVRLIVPIANSSSSYDAFVALNQKVGVDNIIDTNGLVDEKWVKAASSINLFLQYWVIQAIVSALIMSFAPVLAWIPLSTHMTWLLWAYVQLESTTKRIYNTLEWELVAFGVLKKSETILDGEKGGIDLNDTISMQLLNSIMERVPSNNRSALDEANATILTQDDQDDKGDNSKISARSETDKEDDDPPSPNNDLNNEPKNKSVTLEDEKVRSTNPSRSDDEGSPSSARECNTSSESGLNSKDISNENEGIVAKNIVLKKSVIEDKEDYVCISSGTEGPPDDC